MAPGGERKNVVSNLCVISVKVNKNDPLEFRAQHHFVENCLPTRRVRNPLIMLICCRSGFSSGLAYLVQYRNCTILIHKGLFLLLFLFLFVFTSVFYSLTKMNCGCFRLSLILDIQLLSSCLPLQTMLPWMEVHIDHFTCEKSFTEIFHFEIENLILVFIFNIYVK